MKLIIQLEVKDKIEAYRVITRLGFEHKVLEANFDGKIEIFNEKHKTKDFLKETHERYY